MDDLLRAVHDRTPSSGLTHQFYRYPAQFSPSFARAVIKTFTNPGDLVLDPFMGGGTVLVEALAQGRNVIGSDISRLSYFIARAKTSKLSRFDLIEIETWCESLSLRNLHTPDKEWGDENYRAGVPWQLRSTIENINRKICILSSHKQRQFVRLALMRTSQWALDCKKAFPTVAAFRNRFRDLLKANINGMWELKKCLSLYKNRPWVSCFRADAENISTLMWKSKNTKHPQLILTSPPYPRVHVLYHRWQLYGRRETSLPFWLAGERDGMPGSFYNMGSRTDSGLRNYFDKMGRTYSRLRSIIKRDQYIVQLISFSNYDEQLPEYLDIMNRVGFKEVSISVPEIGNRIWRKVPLRKWYSYIRKNNPSSQELFLIHKAR